MARVIIPMTFWFVSLGCLGKFVQIKAKNAVIALAMASIINTDMCKFYSKIMDKSNRFWYISLIVTFILFSFFLKMNGQTSVSHYQHFDMRHGLAQMKVHCIYEDSQGIIWVGTRNGLSKFDGKNFTNYFKSDGLLGNRIMALAGYRDDKLLIVTENGINIFDGQSFESIEYSFQRTRGDIFLVDSTENRWLFHDYYQYYEIDMNNPHIHKSSPEEFEQWKLDEGKELFEMKAKNWNWGKKIHSFNTRQEFLNGNITIDNRLSFQYHVPQFDSLSLMVLVHRIGKKDFECRLVSGVSISFGNKLCGLTKSGRYWELDIASRVESVIETRSGQIIVGTESGIYVIFQSWFEHFEPLVLPYVWSVIESDDGFFYTNSFDHGLHKLSPDLDVHWINSKLYGSSLFVLMKSSKDGEGNIYFPFAEGLMKKNQYDEFELILREETFSTHFDAHRDWIVTSLHNGIHLYGQEKDEIIDLVDCGIQEGQYYNSISQDLHNRYWLSSYSGLCVYDSEIGQTVALDPEYDEILGNGAFGMFQEDSVLWVGLSDGLAKINVQTLELERIHSVQLNTMVKGIIDLNDSLLLIGAKAGLYVFNRKRYLERGETFIYPINDYQGFLGIEPGFDCFYKDSKDRIWITAANHLSIFHPDPAIINHEQLQPNFTFINGERIHFDHKSRTYEVGHNTNDIEVDFEAIGLIRPEKTMFSYQLDELPWSVWSEDTRLFLNNLRHGKHKLLLKAGPTDLPSEDLTMDELLFSISIPFYNRSGFRALFLTLVSGVLLYYLINYYIVKNRQKKYAKNLKQVQYLKNQVLMNELNPHFIFNALATIQSNIIDGNNIRANERIMRLSKLIRSLLNSSYSGNIAEGSESVGLVSVKDEFTLLKHYLAFEQDKKEYGFEYDFNISEGLDTEGIFIPPMLLQPLVENAVKHGISNLKTRQGEIIISLKEEGEYIQIGIIDNGVGIEASKMINQQKVGKPASIATKILEERIALLNKLGHEIVFAQKSSEMGTRITLKFHNE